jgi:hypothetical protein
MMCCRSTGLVLVCALDTLRRRAALPGLPAGGQAPDQAPAGGLLDELRPALRKALGQPNEGVQGAALALLADLLPKEADGRARAGPYCLCCPASMAQN